MKYRIIETKFNGISTFRVQYKKIKWYWFGWRSCYTTPYDNPMTYSSYINCLKVIEKHQQDGVFITYI